MANYFREDTFTASSVAVKMGLKSAVELNRILEKLGIQKRDKLNNSWIFKCGDSKEKMIVLEEKLVRGYKVVVNRKFTWAGILFIKEKLKEQNLYKGW